MLINIKSKKKYTEEAKGSSSLVAGMGLNPRSEVKTDKIADGSLNFTENLSITVSISIVHTAP